MAPIAWWTFDQTGSGTALDSAGSVHGTLAGPAAMIAGGISGGALDTRNGGWSDMGNNFAMAGTAFSMQTWILTESTASTSSIIAGKHTTGHFNGYMMRTNLDGGGYGTASKASFYQSNSQANTAVGLTTVTDGVWHHLVATYSPGGSLHLYVDGMLDATLAAQPIIGNSSPFMVGGVFSTPHNALINAFDGLIDEVQLYDYVLSPEQVRQLHQNPGTAIPAPGTALAMILGLATIRRRRISTLN